MSSPAPSENKKGWEWPGNLVDKGIEKVKWVGSYISQFVRGSIAGVFQGTVGAVGRGLAAPFLATAKAITDVQQIGKDMMARVKEQHNIGKLSPIISGIALATAVSIGNALYLGASPAIGAATAVAEGGGKIGSAIFKKYDAHYKGAAAGSAAAEHKEEHAEGGH